MKIMKGETHNLKKKKKKFFIFEGIVNKKKANFSSLIFFIVFQHLKVIKSFMQ